MLSAAQVLAQQLNAMTVGVQALRQDAEHGLADSVRLANESLEQIAKINRQIAALPTADTAWAHSRISVTATSISWPG